MAAPLALTVPQAADRLGCSEWLIRQAVARGELPVLPRAIAGSRVLIPVAALEARLIEAAGPREAAR